MARVTVKMPKALDLLPRDIENAARIGLNVGGEESVTRVKRDPRMPVDRGRLRGGMAWQNAKRVGSKLVGVLISAGVAGRYADVQDKGRRAGARSPPFSAISDWTKRQRKAQLEALARRLQAAYAAAHPAKRKGKSRGIAKFRNQALYLMTRGTIRKLKVSGMPGARFMASVDGPDGFLARRVRRRISQQIGRMLRQRRLGS